MSCTTKHILRVLTIDTAIALISPILNLVLNQSVSFHHLLVNFRYSLVYSHTIGGLAFATLPTIWPAVRDFAAPLRWLARVVALFAVTLIGAMLACLVFVALGWIPLQ